MGALATRGTHTIVKSLGGEVVLIPFTFTTSEDSGSVATLGYSFNGNVELDVTEGNPDLYVFSIGSYKQYLACPMHCSLDTTVQLSVTGSASAGTVTISCATNALADATVTGCIIILK